MTWPIDTLLLNRKFRKWLIFHCIGQTLVISIIIGRLYWHLTSKKLIFGRGPNLLHPLPFTSSYHAFTVSHTEATGRKFVFRLLIHLKRSLFQKNVEIVKLTLTSIKINASARESRNMFRLSISSLQTFPFDTHFIVLLGKHECALFCGIYDTLLNKGSRHF